MHPSLPNVCYSGLDPVAPRSTDPVAFVKQKPSTFYDP